MAEILVNAPLDKVFAAISDLTQHTNFAAHDIKIDPVEEGPVAVGKRYTSGHPNAKALDQLEITELVPNERFSFHVVMPKKLEVHHTFTLKSQNEGCVVTRDSNLTSTPGMLFLVRPLFAIAGPMATKKNLKNLKAWLEQGAD